jgi:acyl dehydratase
MGKKTPEEFLEEARKMIGNETETKAAAYPVEYESLRRYCMMVDDTNPLFTSPEYARETKYGEVICPPFAPFGIMPGDQSAYGIIPERPGPFLINMSQDWEWMKPIKVGDRLSYKLRLYDVFMKKIRIDPKAFWIVFETEVTNQDGETVCVLKNTLLSHRAPDEAAKDGE